MTRPQQLLRRLNEIGAALARTEGALALIGLGSVGRELERLDAYSDLDFFVIVAVDWKRPFLENLAWLSAVHPIVYRFRNTADGYKLLFADGIFAEMAIFTSAELTQTSFPPGRAVWQAAEMETAVLTPPPAPDSPPRDVAWLIGEALTNLYVGLGRYRRGEKLSAVRFIQGYAVDRIVELAADLEPPHSGDQDPYAAERRFEQRFPQTARHLPQFVAGYDQIPASARAILHFLDANFDVNEAMKREILALCG